MSTDIGNEIEQLILGLADSIEQEAKDNNAEQLNKLQIGRAHV